MRSLLPASVVVLLATAAAAQVPRPDTVDKVETPHLSVSTSVGPKAPAAGSKVSLYVDIAPKPKMHVYAPGEKDAISVTLTIEPNTAFKAAAAEFPPPQKYFFAPLNLTQLVYSKPFRIVQPLTLARTSPAGDTITIKGSLRYQACDDTVCYIPKNVPLSWTVGR